MYKVITIAIINKRKKVYLQYDNRLIDSVCNNEIYSETELLIPDIENLLAKNNLSYKDLSHLSVMNGPANSLSLKCSITCTKAMKVLLNIPVITNNMFEIISYNRNFDYLVLNAYCNFFNVMDFNKNYYRIKKDDLKSFLPKNSLVLTDIEEVPNILDNNSHVNLITDHTKAIMDNNYKKIVENNFTENLSVFDIL